MGSSVKNLDLLKQKERSVDKTVAILDLIAKNHPGSFEMLSEKYGELAAQEKDKIMKEYYTDKSRWYSKASE